VTPADIEKQRLAFRDLLNRAAEEDQPNADKENRPSKKKENEEPMTADTAARDPNVDKKNQPRKKEKKNEKSKSADTTLAATVFPKYKGNGKRAPLKDTADEKSGGMPNAKRIRLGDKWMEDKLEETKGSVVTWP
jgi:hypothetical protein